jgi:hypothetical protein
MRRDLWQLLLWSARGRVRRLARQLRQPRYLITFLAGAGYLVWIWGFVIFRPRIGNDSDAGALGGITGTAEAARSVHILLALGVALAVTFAWILLRPRPRLTLSPAEIHTLLPAPIPRRQILAFALLRNQPVTWLSALIFALLRGNLLLLPLLWAMITLADWHTKGLTLWKVRCKEAPGGLRWLLRGGVMALFGLFWIVIAARLSDVWPTIQGMVAALREGQTDAFKALLFGLPTEFMVAFEGGDGVLAPFLWLTAPFLPRSVAGPAAVVGGGAFLLALLGLHYFWVVGSGARFEESLLEAARKAERRRAGRPERPKGEARRRHPFALPPRGLPEMAIVWKNLLMVTRMPLRRVVSFCIAFHALVYLAAAQVPPRFNLPVISLVIAITLVAVLPAMTGLILRMDLRCDLEKIELARCWPFRGWRLVLAEITVPTLVITFVAFQGAAILLAVALGSPPGEASRTSPGDALLFLTAGVPVALGLAALSTVALNGLTLLFPTWIPLGLRPRSAGPANAGSAALLFLGNMVVLGAGLVPVIGAVGITTLLLQWAGAATGVMVVTAGLLATVLLLAEVLTLAVVMGRRWDRLDPSKELLSE